MYKVCIVIDEKNSVDSYKMESPVFEFSRINNRNIEISDIPKNYSTTLYLN